MTLLFHFSAIFLGSMPPYPHTYIFPYIPLGKWCSLHHAWGLHLKISLPVIKHLNSLKCASSTLICCAINMVPFWWEGRRHQCNFLWSVIIGMVISMSNLSDLWLILSAFHDGHKAITSHLVSWKTGGFVSILKYWAAAAAKQNGCKTTIYTYLPQGLMKRCYYPSLQRIWSTE